MIIECSRCRKQLDSPDERNADYIILPTKRTAIICPACYLEGDILIWGYHRHTPVTERRGVLEVIKTFVKGIIHK